MRWRNFTAKLAAVRRLPGAALLLTGVAVVIYATPAVTSALQYDRLAVASGQWWRLITGHWTHWSADHLWWDAVVFLFLSAICERAGRLRYLVCVFATALWISLALCWTQTNALTYRGLSGIDAALYVLLLGIIVREQLAVRGWTWIAVALLFFAGFVAKVGYEVVTGTTFFVDSTAGGFVPLPSAHAIGAAIGLLTLFIKDATAPHREAPKPSAPDSPPPTGNAWPAPR